MYAGVLHVHGDVRVVVDDVADLGELVLKDGCPHLANLIRPRRYGLRLRVRVRGYVMGKRQLGVINKTIRQLGAYTVSKRCKQADWNHPTRASRATQSAGENSSRNTMHILETNTSQVSKIDNY
jgi:hypothetical protein